MLALRSIAQRVLQLTAEEGELAREIEALTRDSHRNCSTSPAFDRTPPHNSSKRYLARSLYRLLEPGAPLAT